MAIATLRNFLICTIVLTVYNFILKYDINGTISRNLRTSISDYRVYDYARQNSLTKDLRGNELTQQLTNVNGPGRILAGGGDDDDEGGHPPLFEAVSHLEIELGTWATFVIIGFIILLKNIIGAMHTITHDTPFEGMLTKIEEELMIVGTSSFVFKIVLNTSTFGDNKWAYPLEFGEVLIPLVAFSYCGLGIMLILVSLKQCFIWSRAQNLKVLEILDDYFEDKKRIYFPLIWKPFFTSINQMEFRIFHHLFCATFRIRKDAFAFDEYVTKVFQRNLDELLEIRLQDWFYIVVVLCLNLIRVKLNWQYSDCENTHDKKYYACDERRQVILFTIVGGVIVGFNFLIWVASRRIELKILRRQGLTSHLQYAKYIQTMEIDSITADGHRMDAERLKSAAATQKKKNDAGGKSSEKFQKMLMAPIVASAKNYKSIFKDISSSTIREGTLTFADIGGDDAFAVGSSKHYQAESNSASTPAPGATTGATGSTGANAGATPAAAGGPRGNQVFPVSDDIINNFNGSSSNGNINGGSTSKGGEGDIQHGLEETQKSDGEEKDEDDDDDDDDDEGEEPSRPISAAVAPGLNSATAAAVDDRSGGGGGVVVPFEDGISPKTSVDKDMDQMENGNPGKTPAVAASAGDTSMQNDGSNHAEEEGSDEDRVVIKKKGRRFMSGGVNKKPKMPVEIMPMEKPAEEKKGKRKGKGSIQSSGKSASSRRLSSALMLPANIIRRTMLEEWQLSKSSEDVMDVFWLGTPEIYFEMVQICFLFIAVYLAMWFTNMATTAPTDMWRAVSVLPVPVCCFMYVNIIKTAAIIKSVHQVDHDVMLEVLEESEEVKQLSMDLRNKIVEKLEQYPHVAENPFQKLEALYNEIDENGNGTLSRSEFGEFLELLEVTFSRRKWEKIYKEIDINYDNQISFHEFYLFLYPKHDLALTMETRRMKAISKRVMARANAMLATYSPWYRRTTTTAPLDVAASANVSVKMKKLSKSAKERVKSSKSNNNANT